MDTYLDEIACQDALGEAVLHTAVHRRTRIAMETAATTLRSEMHVDGEEDIRFLIVSLGADHLPLCDQWLATCGPSRVSGIDSSRVELQGRSIHHSICVERSAWIRLV